MPIFAPLENISIKKTEMQKKLFVLLYIWLTVAMTTNASSTIPVKGKIIQPDNPNICYVGRISFSNPLRPTFNWPGIEIAARFTGTSLKMIAKPKSGYFVCSIDGAEPFKVSFNSEKDSVVNLATALQDRDHEVRLTYIIEGLQRHAEFLGFAIDDNATILPPPIMPERKIEFIGNSITCAFGIESIDGRDPYEDETENHYLSYAAIVSRNLNAQHFAIARSGHGVYRNYNGPREGTPTNLPGEYAYTIFEDYSEKWDFARWTPQVVCINLGTNDFSTNNYDPARYEEAYRNFIRTIRAYYPDAAIVLLNGPMLKARENKLQASILNKLQREFHKQGDKHIFRFEFSFQTGELGYGACYHPSLKQHERMAEELTPFLRQIMNW